MSPNSRRIVRTASVVIVAVGLAAAPVRGAQTRAVQDTLNKARADCIGNMKAAAAAKTEAEPPPQPEPTTTAVMAPGTSAPVTLKRAYIRGTKFLVDVEGVTISNAAAANGAFSATLAVAPDHGPGYVHLQALHPIDCSFDIVPIAFINTVYRFDLKAANGWTIRAVPSAKTFTVDPKEATLDYTFEFLRANETKPFETRVGNMRYYGDKTEQSRLDLNIFEPESSAKAELEDVTKKMSDPKLTDAQRDALGQRYGKLMQQMQAEMMAFMSDPAAAQKKIDDFGCGMIQFDSDPTGKGTGSLSCGKNVGDNGNVQITGSISIVK